MLARATQLRPKIKVIHSEYVGNSKRVAVALAQGMR